MTWMLRKIGHFFFWLASIFDRESRVHYNRYLQSFADIKEIAKNMEEIEPEELEKALKREVEESKPISLPKKLVGAQITNVAFMPDKIRGQTAVEQINFADGSNIQINYKKQDTQSLDDIREGTCQYCVDLDEKGKTNCSVCGGTGFIKHKNTVSMAVSTQVVIKDQE